MITSTTKLELLFKALVHLQMNGLRLLLQLGTYLSKTQFNFYRTAMTSLLVPPLVPSVRGQNKLHREAFTVKLKNIPYICTSTSYLNKVTKQLKGYILKLPNFKPVSITDSNKSIVYLDPTKIKEISDDLKEELEWSSSYKENDLTLTFENWSSFEVLRAILPEEIEVPTSYSLIGHIVHLNLRDEQLPFKHIIGQVLLEKIPQAKTVINKLDNIDNTYRNFQMEILAGEQNTITDCKEHGFCYRFDFSKVYWNPRLSTEHATLVKLLKAGDVLYDVFAGVGPFSIPASKKGVKVLANDLNPESYKWLLENARINKAKESLRAFNKDGRDFLKEDVKRDLLERREKREAGAEHISMNLPALAVEFLDVFSSWLTREEADKVLSRPPTVHVYCFVKAGRTEDWRLLARRSVEERLGRQLESEALVEIHHVRNVAPNKEMMRVSFLLGREPTSDGEPAKKRTKLDESDNSDTGVAGSNGKEQGQS